MFKLPKPKKRYKAFSENFTREDALAEVAAMCYRDIREMKSLFNEDYFFEYKPTTLVECKEWCKEYPE